MALKPQIVTCVFQDMDMIMLQQPELSYETLQIRKYAKNS